MSEIVEADMLGSNGFQYLVMGMAKGIRIEHGAGLGRGEHERISWVFLVFRHQQVYRLLRDCQRSHGILCLGLAHHQLTVDAVHLLGDGDGLCLDIQVSPEKGEEFTPPQAGGQLQIERCQQATLFSFRQIRPDLVLRQDLHFPLFQLGQLTALGGVGEDQPLCYCLIETVTQQGMDTPYHAGTETLALQCHGESVPLEYRSSNDEVQNSMLPFPADSR